MRHTRKKVRHLRKPKHTRHLRKKIRRSRKLRGGSKEGNTLIPGPLPPRRSWRERVCTRCDDIHELSKSKSGSNRLKQIICRLICPKAKTVPEGPYPYGKTAPSGSYPYGIAAHSFLKHRPAT